MRPLVNGRQQPQFAMGGNISSDSGGSTVLPDNTEPEDSSTDRYDTVAGSFNSLLIEMESNIKYSAQSSNWPRQRSRWMSQVNGAGDNVSKLRKQLVKINFLINFWRNKYVKFKYNS